MPGHFCSMTTSHPSLGSARRSAALTMIVGATLLVSSCATGGDGPGAGGAAPDAPVGYSLGSLAPGLPDGEVVGTGTVLDRGGDAELCLGPVAESAPPQCEGIPLVGWDWTGLDGQTTMGDATWGAYAVQGTYDRASFTVTQPPILLALYDPMAPEDPTGGVAGDTDEATLLEIQAELPDRLGADYFASYPDNGHLWVDVAWDDGTWQKAADDDFGEGTVIIRSALREVG